MKLYLVHELDLLFAVFAMVAAQILHGGDNARFVEDRRPQPSYQPPRLVRAFPDQAQSLVEYFAGRGEILFSRASSASLAA